MNKEYDEKHICGLEMAGGLNGIEYKQQFVKAPKSQYPGKAPSTGKETPKSEAMNITMCK